MSRRCELSGVNRQIGHKVSHSNIKTKREFKPNLVDVTLTSDALNRAYKLRVTAAALEVSSVLMSRSPGLMKWVKLRAVSNLVLVRIGQVSRVSSAVQSKGSWNSSAEKFAHPMTTSWP